MSSNSEKQEEAIDNLDELATAQPFTQIHVDTNAGDPMKVTAIGQTGNVQEESDGLIYATHLLAAHLLMIENAYDIPVNELAKNAVQTAEGYKQGKESAKLEFELEKGWE